MADPVQSGKLILRLAAAEDVEAVMQVIWRVVPRMQAAGNMQWNEHYPGAEVFLQDVRRGELWLAVDACGEVQKVVGVATFAKSPSPEYADVGWDLSLPALVLHRLAVDPEAQGKGIARALLIHAEAEARRQGVDRIRLDTNTQNVAMRSLLEKLGYAYAGEISLHGREGLRFCCYEKLL